MHRHGAVGTRASRELAEHLLDPGLGQDRVPMAEHRGLPGGPNPHPHARGHRSPHLRLHVARRRAWGDQHVPGAVDPQPTPDPDGNHHLVRAHELVVDHGLHVDPPPPEDHGPARSDGQGGGKQQRGPHDHARREGRDDRGGALHAGSRDSATRRSPSRSSAPPPRERYTPPSTHSSSPRAGEYRPSTSRTRTATTSASSGGGNGSPAAWNSRTPPPSSSAPGRRKWNVTPDASTVAAVSRYSGGRCVGRTAYGATARASSSETRPSSASTIGAPGPGIEAATSRSASLGRFDSRATASSPRTNTRRPAVAVAGS